MARAAVTIDVDSLSCYRAIHGLPEAPLAEDPIYTTAVPRFFELLRDAKIPATLFLIGADAPAHAERFAPVQETRSEIASHSFAHDYRLSLRTREDIVQDLRRADEALRPLSPFHPITGFRAPGYNTSKALLEAVLELGYGYDSSLLPAPLYFAARATAIAVYRARGRDSSSLAGDVRAFTGPLVPYRTTPDAPWRRVQDGPLLELPIGVDPRTRTPLFGTSLTTLPPWIFDPMVDRMLERIPLFTLELHAIDLLDSNDDGVPRELAAAQADLRVPWKKKQERLSKLFDRLKRNADVATLRTHAK